jgi:hypothetical protein
MKSWQKLIVSCVILLHIASCKKDNEDKSVRQLSVIYYLTSQDKSLFDFYYSNSTISFIDSNSNHIVFHADTLLDFTMHDETDLRDGEMLQLRYLCQPNYFPNYSISLRVTAKANDVVDLNIQFATGTYWNNQNNDYVLSSFYFNPKRLAELDSINPWGGIVHYDYTDSIFLRGVEFDSVFYNTNQIINTDVKQTKTCYFALNKGVVAFHNLDEKLWIKE